MGCTALCQLINRSVSASLVFVSKSSVFIVSSNCLMSSALVSGSLQSFNNHFWRVSGLVCAALSEFSLIAVSLALVLALPPFLLNSM